MMKKLIALILILVMTFTLASCELFAGGSDGGNDKEVTSSTTDSSTSTTKPTTKPTTTTTGNGQGTNPPEDYIYNAFTSSEKQIMRDLFGEVIPFIPNNDYYFETYSLDYDDGTTETGINFYAVGITNAEFNAYKSEFSAYTYEGTENDEYGDAWYFYTSADGTYYIDLSYYYYEDSYIVDVYAYILSGGGNGGGNSGGSDEDDVNHIYNDFTDAEYALLRELTDMYIPFIPNDEYLFEEYEFNYEDGTGEQGVCFYTIGNTQSEFNDYKSNIEFLFDYDGSEVDEYGDTWYFYTVDYDVYLDMVYYYYDGDYVLEVYIYTITEMSGGSSGGGSDNADSDIITNKGAGLPKGTNGIFNVDFRKADNVKDVTDQGYYLDGCPTTGSPAVLVIPVQFSDVTAASKGYSTDVLVEAFSKGGDVDYYSVYDYYEISSYGQLTLDITVLDEWFTPQYNSNYYYNATYDYYGDQVAIGDQLIMDEALAYLEGKMDLSKFDSDANSVIDAVILINTLDIGEDDFYWAYRYWNIYTDDEGYYYEYDGVSANDYLWASYEFLYESYDVNGESNYDDSSVRNTYTYIHEFGHILGLDDYYDTSYLNNQLLLDGCDMMDGMTGDHNAFSKFNLGWITTSRLVVTDGSITLTLQDFSKNGDTIIIANNWDEKLGAYQEYYILVYYTNNGLNAGDEYGYFSRDGVVVYHVNASLYGETIEGETYYDIYNNNTDASDDYGTKDNLIEFVKSSGDNFTYIAGDTMPTVTDDNGEILGYTFVVDALTSEYATITVSAK